MSEQQIAVVPSGGGIFFDVALFEHSQRVAKVFSTSSMVPDQFKGDMGNCLIALNYAHRVGADPFMAMQNMYVIHGKPAVEAKFAIAVFNASGQWTPLRFRYNDGKTSCVAYATDKATDEECVGVTVTMDMAKAEGWVSKSGSKWKTMPELMLMYRAAMFFIRAYAPEMLLGMQAREEVYDTLDMQRTPNGRYEAMVEKVAPEPSDLKKALTADSGDDEGPGPELTPGRPDHPDWTWDKIRHKRMGAYSPAAPPEQWSGFPRYLHDHRDTFGLAHPEQQTAARRKWKDLYGTAPFPLDPKPEPEPDPPLDPDPDPGPKTDDELLRQAREENEPAVTHEDNPSTRAPLPNEEDAGDADQMAGELEALRRQLGVVEEEQPELWDKAMSRLLFETITTNRVTTMSLDECNEVLRELGELRRTQG